MTIINAEGLTENVIKSRKDDPSEDSLYWIDGAFENSKQCPVCHRYATKIHSYNEPVFDYERCPYCGTRLMMEDNDG